MKIKLAFYITVIIVSFGIIGYAVYFWLGGTEKIEVYQLEGEEKLIVGKPFQGRPTDPQIERQFIAARKLLLDSAIIGTLALVDYRSDTVPDNRVSFFIGIAIDDKMVELPPGYEVRKFNTTQKFAIFLSMHPLVRPTSKRIESLFQESARSINMELQEFFIELHYYDDTMSVEAFGKD